MKWGGGVKNAQVVCLEGRNGRETLFIKHLMSWPQAAHVLLLEADQQLTQAG